MTNFDIVVGLSRAGDDPVDGGMVLMFGDEKCCSAAVIGGLLGKSKDRTRWPAGGRRRSRNLERQADIAMDGDCNSLKTTGLSVESSLLLSSVVTAGPDGAGIDS